MRPLNINWAAFADASSVPTRGSRLFGPLTMPTTITFGFGVGRCRQEVASQLVAFERRKDFTRATDDGSGQPREPRHLNSVTAVRAARHDLAQENDLVLPLARSHVEVDDAGRCVGKIGQLVVVSCEQRFGSG